MTTARNESTRRHALAPGETLVARNGSDDPRAIIDHEGPRYAT
jgi:hypothetical protein